MKNLNFLKMFIFFRSDLFFLIFLSFDNNFSIFKRKHTSNSHRNEETSAHFCASFENNKIETIFGNKVQ